MAKAAKGKGGQKEMLVVTSKVKAVISGKGFKCAGDLPEAVSDAVHKLLDDAAARAKANKRGTVRPQDL